MVVTQVWQKVNPNACRVLDLLMNSWSFFDTHDMGEYWDEMPEANFELDIKKRKHLFAIDADLAEKLTQIAKAKRTPSERLINSWLKEKILEQA